MNTIKKLAINTATIACVLGLTACVGMSSQDKNTAIGTVGGAAVGGLIGNQIKWILQKRMNNDQDGTLAT